MVHPAAKYGWILISVISLFGTLALYFKLVANVVPPDMYKYISMTCREVNCFVFQDGVRGSWDKIAGSQRLKDLSPHFKSDKDIRLRLGLPPTLINADAKCGPRATIGSTNLPHECDPASKWPCCNEGTGWCGITDMHCGHSSSVDYRVLRERHEVDWVVTTSFCVLANIEPEEACMIAETMPSHIVFIGDSQAHEFFIAFVMWLTGDLEYGAIEIKNKELAKQRGCAGEFQVVDPNCRKLVYNKSADVLCGGKLKVEYFYDFDTVLSKRVESKLEALSLRERTYVIIGNGHHYDANHDTYTKHFLDPLVKISEKKKWPKVIIESLPAVPSRAIREKREAFSKTLVQYCNMKPLTLFDNFELGNMLRSFDGIHFGLNFNLLKVKLLLNFLSKECSSAG